jgi:ketosteroid isomerase-like protein
VIAKQENKMEGTSSDVQCIKNLIDRINLAWREGRVDDLSALLHPDIVMVFPEFSGRSEGYMAMVAGFKDFCENARIQTYDESDLQIDAVGNSAVASFSFSMIYERDGSRYRSTGRDLWVFSNHGSDWKAVWRTMIDMQEEKIP